MGATSVQFVSKSEDWQAGDRIGRSRGEDMLITAVIVPEDDAGFRAYLVVVPVAADDAGDGS